VDQARPAARGPKSFEESSRATLSQLINAKAIAIAKLAVRATTTAGSGHPTNALSIAHLIARLMYHTIGRDRSAARSR
jgi:transketolase